MSANTIFIGTRKFSEKELAVFEQTSLTWVLPKLDFSRKVEKELNSIYIISRFMEINRVRAEKDLSIEQESTGCPTLGTTNPNYVELFELVSTVIKGKSTDDKIEAFHKITALLLKLELMPTDQQVQLWDPLIDVRHCLTLTDILSYLWTLSHGH